MINFSTFTCFVHINLNKTSKKPTREWIELHISFRTYQLGTRATNKRWVHNNYTQLVAL